MCQICNNNKCSNPSKCTVKKFTSELTYDGLASTCPELAIIQPNCTSLNQVLEVLAEQLCVALANNGLDGAGYNAESITSQDLDGLLTSRSIVITPIEVPGFTGTAYDIGCRVRLASLADPINDYFEGVVTAFDNNTGAMTFLADHFGPTASGTHIDWNVSLAGDPGSAGAGGVLINSYTEYDTQIVLSDDPGYIDNVYFVPVGYSVLTFTNTSGLAKDFIVHFNYDYGNDSSASIVSSWVDAAIFSVKLGPVTNNEWEHNGVQLIASNMYDGVAPGDIVNLSLGDPYETRMQTPIVNNNANLMKKVTLADTETIEIRFRSKFGNSDILKKAQMFIQEL